MEMNNNNDDAHSERDSIFQPHICVPPMPENPLGYPPFDMRLVPNYTNNQIAYYYTTGAISAADQARFHQLMKQRKTSLDLIGWDGESDGGNDKENGRGNNDTSTLDDNDPSSDSDCPVPLPNFKGIKICLSDCQGRPKSILPSTFQSWDPIWTYHYYRGLLYMTPQTTPELDGPARSRISHHSRCCHTCRKVMADSRPR